MTNSLSEADKQAFLRAAERRRERGIRLRRISLAAEESQVVAFNELYSAWVERWGKSGALDRVIRIMAGVETKLRDKDRASASTSQR